MGGAIYNNGSLTLTNSTLIDNIAGTGGTGSYHHGPDHGATGFNGVGGYGGAIHNSGSLTITNSTLISNAAGYSSATGEGAGGDGGIGGGIYNDGSLMLTNSTLISNTAGAGGNTDRGRGGDGGAGGGSYNDGSLMLTNSTLVNNAAGVGGGGDGYNGGNNNGAGGTGGGIYGNSQLTIKNSIIANNSAAVSPDCAGAVSGHYNLIEDSTGCGFTPDGTDIIGSDPLLGPLQNNGGLTISLRPTSGSPVIDNIPDANCLASPINGIDQRGATRNFNGDGSPSGNECDIGAVEYHPIAENCTLSTGSNLIIGGITFNISSMGTLACIKVENMGTVDHLRATTGIQTGSWWHIYGEDSGGNRTTNGFNLTMTVPFAGANASTRLCKYPGNLGGAGWNCDDGSNTTFDPGNTVTRSIVDGFSDWAIGNNVGPTAVSLQTFSANSTTPVALVGVGLLALLLVTAFVLRKRNE